MRPPVRGNSAGACAAVEYDYTSNDKVVIVNNARKEPSQVTILATGEKLDCRMDGTTLVFAIPADRTTSLLDVIKVQW